MKPMRNSDPSRSVPRRRAGGLALALALALPGTFVFAPGAMAYSYAAAAQEPLLDGRQALFTAAASGDWAAVQAAYEKMKPDFDYLDQNEGADVAGPMAQAIRNRDAGALRGAFTRAAAAEIIRRLNGARDNLSNYQTAKLLVVTANRFYTAVAADLPPEVSQTVGDEMKKALDSIGNPGVFGVGTKPADPAAFDAARAAIAGALKTGEGAGVSPAPAGAAEP